MLDPGPAQGNGTLVPEWAGSMVGRTRAPSVGRPYQVPEGTSSPVAARLPRVTRRSSMPGRRTSARAAGVLILVAAVVAACGGGPAASFDVAAGCPVEGRAAGAYPDLEERIPTSYEGRAPDTLDSGRHCDPDSLGSLAKAGFDEVRFAGGHVGLRRRTGGRARRIPGAGADGAAGRRFLRHERTDSEPHRRSPGSRRPRSSGDPAIGSTR